MAALCRDHTVAVLTAGLTLVSGRKRSWAHVAQAQTSVGLQHSATNESRKPLGLILASNAAYPRAAAEVSMAGYEPMQVPAPYNKSHRCRPEGGYAATMLNIYDTLNSMLESIVVVLL